MLAADRQCLGQTGGGTLLHSLFQIILDLLPIRRENNKGSDLRRKNTILIFIQTADPLLFPQCVFYGAEIDLDSRR